MCGLGGGGGGGWVDGKSSVVHQVDITSVIIDHRAVEARTQQG